MRKTDFQMEKYITPSPLTVPSLLALCCSCLNKFCIIPFGTRKIPLITFVSCLFILFLTDLATSF